MREKIKQILINISNFNGSENYIRSGRFITPAIEEIFSTIIESLPEEDIFETKSWNEYRSEVINLLRGTK